MKKIKIVIVDSGVRTDHPKFCEDTIVGFRYREDGCVEKGLTDDYGHGTAVYGIIRKALPYADILNIQIPGIENGIEEETLCRLLYYLADKVPADVINLSLGLSLCGKRSDLYNACRRLEHRGTVILSAFDNGEAISYPAAFSNVIGVTSGILCRRPEEFEYQEDSIVNLAGKGSIQRLAWTSPDYLLMGGNSFACAHATVQAAAYMAKGARTKAEVLEQFKRDAVIRRETLPQREPPPLFSISRAALFPFGKEMHSLLRFHDMLSFRIAKIYDVKYTATIGASVRHLMKDTRIPDIIIENIERVDWEDFDTIILGHMGQLAQLVKQPDLAMDLAREALLRGKKVVAFDDLRIVETGLPMDKVYCPVVRKEHMPGNRFGKLYRCPKPVLGIFGTSSRQGKFTLQLYLRKELMYRGYRVGQLGTEPSSLLFGMDEVYPMGYHSSVYIQGFDAVRYLNDCMNRISEKENDLILVGSQSGTLSYDTGNIAYYALPQYELLMGTLPDAVVLCVNPFDDRDYIRRTIQFIESATEGKVIALCLFPMELKSETLGAYGGKRPIALEKRDVLRQSLQEEYARSVFLLGEESDIRELTDSVINFFAEN